MSSFQSSEGECSSWKSVDTVSFSLVVSNFRLSRYSSYQDRLFSCYFLGINAKMFFYNGAELKRNNSAAHRDIQLNLLSRVKNVLISDEIKYRSLLLFNRERNVLGTFSLLGIFSIEVIHTFPLVIRVDRKKGRFSLILLRKINDRPA